MLNDVCLELDAGNTRIKWRLRRGDSVLVQGSAETLDELLLGIQQEGLQGAVDSVSIASVRMASEEERYRVWVNNHFACAPWFAQSASKALGVMNAYTEPERLGVDRWLAFITPKAFDADCANQGAQAK